MNNREDEGQEEGEYHFSDDQINYEMDGPEPQAGATSVTAFQKPSGFPKLTARYKIVLGVIVVAVLMSIIIKILVPAKPPTDFVPAGATLATTQTNRSKPVQAAANGQVVATKPVAPASAASALSANKPQTVTQPSSISSAPSSPANGAVTLPAVPASTTAMATTAGVPVPATTTPPSALVTPSTSTTNLSTAAVSSPSAGIASPQANVSASAPSITPQATSSQNVLERLATVEQQNAAMVNLLQTEYAQKMADYETQVTTLREKMDEISKHLNRVEANLNQIAQVAQLQNQASEMGAAPLGPRIARPAFTVQAIIPGRAWLKSESGETVTVAEGDLLRDYGRIIKIDPYDGIVKIDTGNRTMTLSYGMSD